MGTSNIRILAIGDIFLGEHPFTLNHGVTSIAKDNGCDYLFDKIKMHLTDADIVFGNLEGIISPKSKNEVGIKSAIYWGESSCAKALHNAGFNCLSLANNHTAQHGEDVLKRTCKLLDELGIKWTGYNPSDPEHSAPAIFTINSIQVGFLAYCDTQQYHLERKILPTIKLNGIIDDIRKLKKECEIVVISLHWGDEFIEYPSPEQIHIAHKLIDSGAQLILGHHSHSMQGIEQYKNGLIVYSLGSFIKDLWRKELRESIILDCELTKDGVTKYKLTPIYINDNYQPEIYSGDKGKNFIKRLNNLSKKIDSINLSDSEEATISYLKEVRSLTEMDRQDNIRHYLKNIFRYDKKLLFGNIIMIIMRRIRKKNI